MTSWKRNDQKQLLQVVLRERCFKKWAKSVKLVKKSRFSKKYGTTYFFKKPHLQVCCLPDAISFSLLSSVRTVRCPDDVVGVWSITWKSSNLRFNIFVLTQPYNFFVCLFWSVCNFQSMKRPVELKHLLLKLSLYVACFDERRYWRSCKCGLFVKSHCFFETIP